MTRAVLLTVLAGLAVMATPARAQLAGKKVLLINSYHEGYAWSDGEVKGEIDAIESPRLAARAGILFKPELVKVAEVAK